MKMDTILSIYLGGGSTLSIISKISQNLSSFETKVESEYKNIFFSWVHHFNVLLFFINSFCCRWWLCPRGIIQNNPLSWLSLAPPAPLAPPTHQHQAHHTLPPSPDQAMSNKIVKSFCTILNSFPCWDDVEIVSTFSRTEIISRWMNNSSGWVDSGFQVNGSTNNSEPEPATN